MTHSPAHTTSIHYFFESIILYFPIITYDRPTSIVRYSITSRARLPEDIFPECPREGFTRIEGELDPFPTSSNTIGRENLFGTIRREVSRIRESGEVVVSIVSEQEDSLLHLITHLNI